MKISVIIPVYNVEKFLKKCLDSVINQTYKDIEVILVDDDSTDNSGKICDEFANTYSYIEVIHKKNEGLGLARNSGLKVATGDYVIFVDSDDFLEKDTVLNFVNILNKYHADTVIGGYKRVNLNNEVISEVSYDEKLYEGADVYHKLFPKMLGSSPKGNDSIKMSVWNVMYSMDIIKKYNLRFVSERQIISEDIIWNFDYFKHSSLSKVTSFNEYNYRVTPGSLSQKYRPNIFESFVHLYMLLKQRINDENLGKEALNRAQRQFLVNIRYSISNEKKNRNNDLSRRIKDIVYSDTVQEVVKTYPVKELNGFKQKVFIILIKLKMTRLLTSLVK